jgi:DNA-binding transcriptional ArsR family regulator
VVTDGSALLAALGDASRQSIIDHLVDGPRSVGQLAAELPISRPAVSQHLKVLKDVGLVRDDRDGTRRLYHVDPDALAAARAYLDEFWQRSMAAFQAIADASGEEQK